MNDLKYKIFVVLCVIILVGFGAYMFIGLSGAIKESDRQKDSCNIRGGVVVKTVNGSYLCLDRSAILK